MAVDVPLDDIRSVVSAMVEVRVQRVAHLTLVRRDGQARPQQGRKEHELHRHGHTAFFGELDYKILQYCTVLFRPTVQYSTAVLLYCIIQYSTVL